MIAPDENIEAKQIKLLSENKTYKKFEKIIKWYKIHEIWLSFTFFLLIFLPTFFVLSPVNIAYYIEIDSAAESLINSLKYLFPVKIAYGI